MCKVPALKTTRQPLNAKLRTVGVTVVVEVQGMRSAQSSPAALTYTGVPAYFACQTVGTHPAFPPPPLYLTAPTPVARLGTAHGTL